MAQVKSRSAYFSDADFLFVRLVGFVAFSFARCCGGDLATTSTARSKRCHASALKSSSFADFAMPRQPFLPAFAKRPCSVGLESIEARPEFARLIGFCVAAWSYVENEMAILLGLLLGVQSSALVEVFLTLRRSSNQREALNAAAKHKLSGEPLLAFEALMIIYKSLEDQRNALVHGCFGNPQDMPDAILWIEMKNHVHFMTDAIAKAAANSPRSGDAHAKLTQNLFVYRLSDFEKLHVEIKTLSNATFYLAGYLLHQSNSLQVVHEGRQMTISDRLFEMLCDVPQIQQEMLRLKADRETTPAAR
jgi:hypothetical protein